MGSILGEAGGQSLGAYEQGHGAAQAAHYNAMVSWANAKIAGENANIAGQAGSEQAAVSSQKTRAMVGAIKTNQAASGVDVNSGSAAAVQSSAQELGKLDAMTIRSNAAKEAYGYKVQEAEFNNQGDMDRLEAKYDEAGAIIGAGTTFLGSLEQSASEWSKYAMAGGLG